MDDWSRRVVLVTGYSGFLGGWVAREAVARGARVVGLVHHAHRPLVGPEESAVELIECDLADGNRIVDVLHKTSVDTVFHLAALALPPQANKQPALAFEVNARGTWLLLEAIRLSGRLPGFVLASTDSVYGENDGTPFDEGAPTAPLYPYEASKICAEVAARSYHRTYGAPVGIARFCNIYGPGDVSESRLIAGTIRCVLRGEAPQLRGDGSSIRNYLYIADAVRALFLLAHEVRGDSVTGHAFNFCDEQPLSVLDVVREVIEVAGRPDLAPRLGGATPGEISVKRASAEKARRYLGWVPEIGLAEGLRRTYEWNRLQQQDLPA